MSRPVYAAPLVVFTTWAVVPRLLFQAEMVPFVLAQMNEAGVPFTTKDEVSLLACPLGPCCPAGVVATVGDSALTPAAVTEYSVLTLVCWSETEKEPSALNEVPHGFLRLGSVSWAKPGMSET